MYHCGKYIFLEEDHWSQTVQPCIKQTMGHHGFRARPSGLALAHRPESECAHDSVQQSRL